MAKKPLGWAWDDLGRTNAAGAILTRDDQLVDWDLDQFWATGTADVARFINELAVLAPLASRARALDFGCGIGRLTRALAAHFTEVTGVDVAESMIRRARSANADRPNCTFVVNASADLSQFRTSSFDVVYSRLVLQHLEPALVRQYVPEMVRVLAPSGVLMFQLPDADAASRVTFARAPVRGSALKRLAPRLLVTAWRRLKYDFVVSRSEAWRHIFGLPRSEVEALIRTAGGRLLATRPDQSHGSDGQGYEYWVLK